MTTFTITRRATQSYNKRVTDHYVDTQTITLAELVEDDNMTPEQFLQMTPEEQEQIIEEYACVDWCLENIVKTEDDINDDGTMDQEDYDEIFEIIKDPA